MNFSPIRYFLGLAALIGFLMPALAASDPPGRVGRLSQAEGNVIFRADRQGPGSPAAINWPISSGAIIDTERRSRAEVWIGSAAYRLAANSRAEFVTVNDRIVDLLLASGTLSVTIRDRDQADDLQISTPGGRIRFPGPGRFRIEVRPGQTSVAAQSGSAEVMAGERKLTVRPGEIASLDERGLLGIDAAPYGDDFDAWVSAQDSRERSNAARRHVSPYMTGHQDLDAYGDWGAAPEYGTVWYPRSVAADWAPYRDGRWAWVEPWGWTWVDAAPWGFAPFHYGRWVQIGGRWGWAPGTYAARPIYAPALVGWVGDPGRNVRNGYAAAPAAGWFPLAPREVYLPGYRTSPSYVRQINVAHVHDHAHIDRALHPDYRPNHTYQRLPQAVTVAPTNALRQGQPVHHQNIRPYDKNALEQAPIKPRDPVPQGLPPESRSRHTEPSGVPAAREFRQASEQPERPPHAGDRQYGRPMPGTPRTEERPPPPMREMQAPPPVQHDPRRDSYRTPQQYREPPQPRQPPAERAAAIPREAPRAMPPQPQLQAPPQALPQRQAQHSAPPMREIPRHEQRPPPPADHQRNNHAPDDRRGNRGPH